MIHRYSQNGLFIVVDVNSGCVHVVDKMIYDILGLLTAPLRAELPGELITFLDYPLDEIKEGYAEIFKLFEAGLLFSSEQKPNFELAFGQPIPVKAACLHVSHDCDLRCRYCFASTGSFGGNREQMSEEVGKKAIDFLVKRSLGRKNLEVDFFGGEPLLNFDVVKKIVIYARNLESKHNKKFRFTFTTNGVQLDDEKIKFINEQMHNVVLSIDGRKAINDNMRRAQDGTGCYDLIMPKFKQLLKERGYKNYYLRGTFTKSNLDFSNDVIHLADAGFECISIEPVVLNEDSPYAIDEKVLPQIFSEYEKLTNKIIKRASKGKWLNFFHFTVAEKNSPCISKRVKGCGAGTEYVAISPGGEIYPCHQLVGRRDYVMGSLVEETFDLGKQAQFAKINIHSKKGCEKCWAKLYCSGGCNANNIKFEHNIQQPYKIYCEIQKKRLECAFVLKATMGE